MDSTANTKVEQEVERHLLSVTVNLSDGTKGHVFSRNPNRNETKQFVYNCHICGVPNLSGERCLYTHLNGRRHQTKVLARIFDAALFRAPLTRTNKIVMQIAPGEPIPPGFENEVKPMAELQTAIDNCKDMSLVGVEYVLELRPKRISDQARYFCVLCESRYEVEEILTHISSYNHRSKYLEKHFPTAMREFAAWRSNPSARGILATAFQSLCEAIEDKYGRLTPNVCEEEAYEKNRLFYVQEVINDKHIDEKMGSTFLHVLDLNSIKQQLRSGKAQPGKAKPSTAALSRSTKYGRARSRSLDSISSISNTSMDGSPIKANHSAISNLNDDDDDDDDVVIVGSSSIGRPNANRTRSRSPQRAAIPTPSQLAMQANEIGKERYKWEKYRCMVELAVKGLENNLKEYEKSPETHPLYPEEWKLFWNRRYKELQAEKKDVTKHDFKPEWIIFWTHRMKELHDEAVEKKKAEIRKKLGLPDDSEERTDELKERYTIKAPKSTEPRGKVPLAKRDERDHREKVKRSRSRSNSRTRTRRVRISRSPERIRNRSRDRSRDRSYERIRGRSREHSRERRERSYERDRERERDRRDRYARRPPSRGSYNGSDDERALHVRRPPPHRDEYDMDYYPRVHAWPPSARPPPPHYAPHYGPRAPFHPAHYYPHERDIPYRRPPHDEGPLEDVKEDIDEPLTVVSVLRLLTALEDLLGPSLGPKVIDMLAKALALEKVKANSADELLVNDDNCVLFETIKEKLKGQLIADVVEKHQIKAVKRAIKNVAAVIHMVSERERNKTPEERRASEALHATPSNPPKSADPEESIVDKSEIAKKIAAALVAQGKTDATPEQLESLIEVYVEMEKKKRGEAAAPKAIAAIDKPAPASSSSTSLDSAPKSNDSRSFDQYQQSPEEAKPAKIHDEEFDLPEDASNALESLTDSDLQTLLQNFKDLSSEEQQHLIAYLKKLESIDPPRVEKLRKYVNLDHVIKASGGSLLSQFAQAKSSGASTSAKATNAPKATAPKSATVTKPAIENDMFYDDSDQKQKPTVLDSDDDDDDYSFDDVFRAASKNVKENERIRRDTFEEKHEPNGRSRINDANIFDLGDDRSNSKPFDGGDEHSNASSRMSGGEVTAAPSQNYNKTLSDTQSIIASLMGSLQKNAQRHYGNSGGGDRGQSQSLGSLNNNRVSPNRDDHQQSMPHLHSGGNQMSGESRPTIQSNIPFYQQQQMMSESSTIRPASGVNQSFANNDTARGIAGQNKFNNAAHEFLQNLLPSLNRPVVGKNVFSSQLSTPMPPMPPFMGPLQPQRPLRQPTQHQNHQQANLLAQIQSQLQQQQQQYPYTTNSQYKRGYY